MLYILDVKLDCCYTTTIKCSLIFFSNEPYKAICIIVDIQKPKIKIVCNVLYFKNGTGKIVFVPKIKIAVSKHLPKCPMFKLLSPCVLL